MSGSRAGYEPFCRTRTAEMRARVRVGCRLGARGMAE